MPGDTRIQARFSAETEPFQRHSSRSRRRVFPDGWLDVQRIAIAWFFASASLLPLIAAAHLLGWHL